MKDVGITRRLDKLGRVVIPKEFRKSLHINDNELLEMFLDNESIVINRYNVISNNDKFLDIYLKLLKRIYDIDVVISDLNNVIYTNNEKYLKQDVIATAQAKGYKLNVNGDLIGYILFYGTSINESIKKLTMELLKKLFE